LAVATACLNLLALADTVYTMILLRRYIAHGFDGTLVLLTLGVLVALALQWLLTSVRRVLAQGLGRERDRALAAGVFAALAGAEVRALHALPREDVAQAAADLGEVRAACDAQAVGALLDAPFALLFTATVFFLSPPLAGVVLLGIVATVAAGRVGIRGGAAQGRALAQARGEARAVLARGLADPDTVRVFRGRAACAGAFAAAQERALAATRASREAGGLAQALAMGTGVLVRVALYGVGAKLVVLGGLSVAGLIGAAIMGSYALSRAAGGVAVVQLGARAAQALERLGALDALPREDGGRGASPAGADEGQKGGPGISLPDVPDAPDASGASESLEAFAGGLGLRGVAFSFGGPALFSGLELDLPPGGVLVVRGRNGVGKTTLLRLLAGLARPTAGEVLADGRPLARLLDGRGMDWWRAQIAWLPQEPFFLPGTVRENILLAAPGLEPGALGDIARRADLGAFLDTSAHGVETPLQGAGRTLPVGIRKRLALARALAAPGRLVLLDEPTAGMDAQGAQAVYEAMNAMVREGRTIVVVSGDPNIVKGATRVLDLDAPTPAPGPATGPDAPRAAVPGGAGEGAP
jgi:ATP-binding cassette subfamily C protein LapB